jgi:long-chain fatty acid transport protein
MWEPLPNKLWVGASWQSQPNVTGDMELEGELQNALNTSRATEPSDVKMQWQLPDIYRVGVRGKVSPELELRLFADYTRWSVFESQCLANADRAEGLEDCKDPETSGVIQVFERQWEDSFGVRAGASYWVTPGAEIMVGGGYDGNAIPDETLDPALMDMDKFTGSLGANIKIMDNLTLGITGTGVFYSERDTSSVGGNSVLERPSKQPSNAGVYNQSIYLLNTNLQYGF